jgi:hypothetical protein
MTQLSMKSVRVNALIRGGFGEIPPMAPFVRSK